MQATREPRTARDLRRALAELGAVERRSNPPEAQPPYVLSFRPAGPGQQWVVLDRFWDRGVAMDSALSPDVARAEDGSLVRLAGGDEPAWLGVMDRGQPREAPSVSRNEPSGETDWLEAWDGPRAEASWMVDQCSHVPHQQITLALAACAATVIPLTAGVVPGEDRVLSSCLRSLRAWASGRADRSAVEKAAKRADEYRESVQARGTAVSMAAYYAASAVVSSLSYERFRDAPRDVTSSVVLAEREAMQARARGERPSWSTFNMRIQRRLAPRVRSFVPLGDVLLAERARLGMRR